jgi:hemoglobin/transferrin/lactoferrin receptor protein
MNQYPTSAPYQDWETLSRLMPPTGQFGVRWDSENKKIWAEAVCTVAGHQEHMPARDVMDTDRIPPGGTPGYCTLDIRAGWTPKEGLEFWAALENVTNTSYRIVGSGVNEPGLNFIFGMKWTFGGSLPALD